MVAHAACEDENEVPEGGRTDNTCKAKKEEEKNHFANGQKAVVSSDCEKQKTKESSCMVYVVYITHIGTTVSTTFVQSSPSSPSESSPSAGRPRRTSYPISSLMYFLEARTSPYLAF